MERTSFTAEFAGIPVAISCPSRAIRDFLADYITERPGAFSVCVTEEDIAAEAPGTGGEESTPVLRELCALHRKIAEALPLYGRFLMHGAAITYGGGAYLFCAPSGVGKSTHIALWRRYLGDGVDIINGDKPFLSLEGVQAQWSNCTGGCEDRVSSSAGSTAGFPEVASASAGAYGQAGEHIRVHGSPWAGKELWQKNRNAVLKAICLVTRGKENSIVRLGAAECLGALMRQIYLPRSAEAAQATLALTDALVRLVPVFQLRCDVSEKAVRCSFEALTGLEYAEKRKSENRKNG